MLWYILSYDIWFYISHVILHNPILYKTIHKEHHSVNYKLMTYIHTYSAHFAESPIQGLGVIFPFLLDMNTHTLFYALILINLRGLLRHDHRFTWLIGNHHLLHHKYPCYNFGEYWLDTLFGTRYPNLNEYVFGLIYT